METPETDKLEAYKLAEILAESLLLDYFRAISMAEDVIMELHKETVNK